MKIKRSTRRHQVPNSAVSPKDAAASQPAIPKLKTYTLKAPVIPPHVPDSLYSKTSAAFPLWAFSEEDIISIGNAYAAALLDKWRQQKEEQERQNALSHLRIVRGTAG